MFSPAQASTVAGQVDALMLFLVVVSGAIALTIFVCIVVFCIRYRQRPGNEYGQRVRHTGPIEFAWTVIPTLLAMIPFVWGAKLYLDEAQPPTSSMEVYVVAKQWMWKTQQPDGQAEINALHVPVGQSVKLTMTSQDVIHSFSVPAFRLKADVLPGRFTTLWFQATQPGDFPLYCSEYCGTDHAQMLGTITVMRPADYAAWLIGGPTAANSPAANGRELFGRYACIDCHQTGRAPNLQGVFGQPVLLSDGSTVTADENYLRESILAPSARIVDGYQPIMPSFAGQISDDELIDLIAYIKSIGASPAGSGPPPPPPASPSPAPARPRPRLADNDDRSETRRMSSVVWPRRRQTYLSANYAIRSWLLTTDHKRIAILYLLSISLMFVFGGFAASMMRLELLQPDGTLVDPETYNKLFTMHGVVMIFFFLIPSIPAVLGNFLVPLMIGARDLAFPRLNLLSWYIYLVGAAFTLWVLIDGGVDTGWTFYTPFSTSASSTHVVATAVGIFIVGFSSILTGLNFIVTMHRMRAPGLTWFRMPLFLWSMYATSVIMVLATPVLAITLLLVAVERVLHVGFFDPALGGDPLLFQNLFWFYSHPAVYIMILPGMGVTSELIAAFARKPVFGYHYVAIASVSIAVLGFLVWGHHMFVSGASAHAALVFSLLSYLVAIPSAIKVFNWTATLYKGSITFHTPLLYALGFIGLFTIGGLTGLFLASLAVDVDLHGTYFVVAHFHYIMVGGMVMAFMGGLHYWWPKITGRLYDEMWAKIAAITIFLGFNLTFFPQYLLGVLGMPRRYHSYPAEFQVLNVLSTAGASILAIGYLLPLIYLLASLRWGKLAGPNPWNATGLEWQTTSPPPRDNFLVTPVVTSPPYDYPTGPT